MFFCSQKNLLRFTAYLSNEPKRTIIHVCLKLQLTVKFISPILSAKRIIYELTSKINCFSLGSNVCTARKLYKTWWRMSKRSNSLCFDRSYGFRFHGTIYLTNIKSVRVLVDQNHKYGQQNRQYGMNFIGTLHSLISRHIYHIPCARFLIVIAANFT